MGNFTHDFEIKYDDKEINGEIEFNVDGKVSYSFTGDPVLRLDESALLNQLFATVQEMYKLESGLQKIEITEKVI